MQASAGNRTPGRGDVADFSTGMMMNMPCNAFVSGFFVLFFIALRKYFYGKNVLFEVQSRFFLNFFDRFCALAEFFAFWFGRFCAQPDQKMRTFFIQNAVLK